MAQLVVKLKDVNKATNLIEDSKSLSSLLEENNLYPNRWYLKPGHENEAIKEIEYYFTRFEINYKIEE